MLHCPEFHTTPVTHPESHMPSLPGARSKSTHSKTQGLFTEDDLLVAAPSGSAQGLVDLDVPRMGSIG